MVPPLSKHLVTLGTVLGIGLTLLCAVRPAHAGFSGLIIVPTADTVGAHTVDLDVQGGDSASTPPNPYGAFQVLPPPFPPLPKLAGETSALESEAGLGNRLEVGYDLQLSDKFTSVGMANAKYVLVATKGGRAALAVGIANIRDKAQAVRYGVLSVNTPVARLHLGALRAYNGFIGHPETFGFLGLDRQLTKRLTLMADITEGNNNGWSVGAKYVVTPRVYVKAGFECPNETINPYAAMMPTLGKHNNQLEVVEVHYVFPCHPFARAK